MSNYDFSLDVKNQNSKKKSKYNTLDSEFIDGFVKDNVKHEFFEKSLFSVKIPPGNIIYCILVIHKYCMCLYCYFKIIIFRMASSRNVRTHPRSKCS